MSIDSVISGLRPRTKWMIEPPTQPGWYWFKGELNAMLDEWTEVEMQVVCLHKDETVSLVDTGYPYPIEKLRGQWLGPIETPRP